MSETTAPPRRREATRQRLLDAAAEVFAEVGLDATSVEAVCERAGFTRGAFYSNFASKEEMLLELAARVARGRVAEMETRVAELEKEGAFDVTPDTAVALVERVLDLPGDDRLGVLLMSEIRMRALRNPDMARAFLAQDAELRASVVRTIEEIAGAAGLRLTVTAEDAARTLLLVWEGTVVRAVMAGKDRLDAQRDVKASIGAVVPLLVAGRD